MLFWWLLLPSIHYMWMPESKNKRLLFEIPSLMGKTNKKRIAGQAPLIAWFWTAVVLNTEMLRHDVVFAYKLNTFSLVL